MKKLTFVLALLAAFSFAAKAQDFTPYPYIQIQGGASYDFGEADFAKLLSPAAQVAVGYRFDDYWSARFAVDGWQAKHDSRDTKTIYGFQFVQPNLDLILDWSSGIFGYRADRPFTVYSFVGAGIAIGLENKKANELAATEHFDELWQPVKAFYCIRPGLGVDIRLGDRVSLNLECDAHFLPESFDSRVCSGANSFDVHMAVLGGLKFNLGWRPRKVVPAAPVVTYQPPAPRPEPKKEEPKKEEPKKEFKEEPVQKPVQQPVMQPIEHGHGCADKADGVRMVCERLGIGLSETAAFGDNYNDCPMLDLVGQPFIMDTAAAELLERYPRHMSDPAQEMRRIAAAARKG